MNKVSESAPVFIGTTLYVSQNALESTENEKDGDRKRSSWKTKSSELVTQNFANRKTPQWTTVADSVLLGVFRFDGDSWIR